MGQDAEEVKVGFLFDLDGVLIDSERSYSRFWKEVDRVYPTGYDNFDRIIKGTTLYDILDRYFSDPEVREKVTQLCLELERNIRYGYEKGAHELLRGLKERGIPVALVTSSDKVKMHNLWLQLPDLRDLLTAVIDAECVTKSKPDPEGYLKGAAALGVAPEHCVVFEDSLTGVKAGRASGSYVIGMSQTLGADVVRPYSDEVHASLEEIDPDVLIALLRRR